MAPNSLFQRGDPGAQGWFWNIPREGDSRAFPVRGEGIPQIGVEKDHPSPGEPFPFGMWPEFLFFLTPDSSRVPKQEFPKDSRCGEVEMFHAEFLSLN